METSFVFAAFACCLLLLGSLPVQAAVVSCDSGWSNFRGNCYYFWNRPRDVDGLSFSEAESKCKQMGAHLVSLHSMAENTFVYNEMRSRSYWKDWFWLGLTDTKGNGKFAWTDGTKLDFTNWNENIHSFPKRKICVNQQMIYYDNTWLIGQDCLGKSPGYVCKKAKRPQPCDSKPCQHGGTCVPDETDYTCNCQPGYDGKNCEKDIDDCDGVTCQHGGTCVDKVNDYQCNCAAGYTGRHCEINIDDCVGVICENGGNCVDLVNSYECNCVAGYTGTHCEIDIDDCDGVTCQHGGTCVDKVDDYQCICPPGYTGRHCEIDIDDCVGVICENGGNCVDLVNSYRCDCVAGYTGTHCEIDIDECADTTCPDDFVCVDDVNFSCCVSG